MSVRQRVNRYGYGLIIIGVLGGFAVGLLSASLKVAPPWDSSAMVYQGRLLAQDHRLQLNDVNNERVGPYFNLMGFDIRSPADPQPYSTFPPGYPLIVATVYSVAGGLTGLYLIAPLMGLFALIATAYIGYQLGGRWTSLLAVLLVGTAYVFIDQSTTPESDGPSVSLQLMSVALYLWAVTSRRRLPAVLSGLCLGLFILVRSVNVAFAALIMVHTLIVAHGRDRWWLISLLSPGVLIGIGGMMLYQAQAYGGPLTNAYQAWGQNRFSFPLFSLQYLWTASPPPWHDYTLNAIVTGLAQEMGVWAALMLVGMSIDRRNPWRLLLAAIVLVTIGVYGVSVFTPRTNMRYMLPALTAGLILAADVAARFVSKLPSRAWQSVAVALIGAIALGGLAGRLPALRERNAGIQQFVKAVVQTAHILPPNAIVLAYATTDTFYLYSDKSVLNYRKVIAGNPAQRNQIVVAAIKTLQDQHQRVYLIRDDDGLFNTIYPTLQKEFALQPVDASLPTFEIRPRPD